MTQTQENHLNKILSQTVALIDRKYRAGQETHGGNLFDLTPTQLIDEALNEAVDQMVYLLTLKAKLIEVKGSLTDSLERE